MSIRLKSALLSLCLSILGIGAPVVFAQQDLAQQQDQTADVLYSNLHKNIQDLFNEYGVQIMTPAYRDDKEVPVVVPKENWYAPPADRFTEGEQEIEAGKETDEVVPA